MGSRRGPSGPSQAEIERQAREQERKVKFESAKGRYLGRVASRELAAESGRMRAESSLEYEDMMRGGYVPESSLFIPERFTPETVNPYKPASADYATTTVTKDSKQYRDLISKGYKEVGQVKPGIYGNTVTLQRGTAEVLPEEAGYSWFTAANLGFAGIAQEYNLAQGNVGKTTGTDKSYNQMLFENLMKYDNWNTSQNQLVQQERQRTAELFRAQYGGMTQQQIESGAWKQDVRNQQKYAGMLFSTENITRGQYGI